jgi:transposase
MLQVNAKIQGFFKSMEFAQGYCRMRGYLVSCKKNGINAYKAIQMLMNGERPAFISAELAKEDTNQKSRDAA